MSQTMPGVSKDNRAPATQASRARLQNARGFFQGLVLALLLAYSSLLLANLPGLKVFGPMVLAILVGMAWRELMDVPASAFVGIRFAAQRLLRAGIVLLGMRLTLGDILGLGILPLLLAVASIAFAFGTTLALARRFALERRLGVLTASGVSVCGAAAVLAVAPQVRANESETAAAVASVAFLGTIFTVLDLLVLPGIPWTDLGRGTFLGATLHEVAHVVAAAYPFGHAVTNVALLVKLTRVALLVPIALGIGLFWREETASSVSPDKRRARPPFPWFVLGFLAVALLGSFTPVPPSVRQGTIDLATFLLTTAMAAIGLSADFVTLRRLGYRAFAVGALASILLVLVDGLLVTLLLR
ncbi:MAG: putative sulfate exporter family transporter [Brockia lithotrophica]|nr:putative sulfate exporter family transporter [Brockia lithotrophica]